MRNKLQLYVLSLVLGAGMCFAGPPTTDSQTVDTIQSRLEKSKVNQHGEVHVAVNGGVATLTGWVDNVGVKKDAEKAARKAQGVTQVEDDLQVRAPNMSDQQIIRQAQHEMYMYYAYTMFDYVDFEFHNGTLIVNGEVTQPFKKVDMGRILQRINGVAEVQNNIEVLPDSRFDDRLRMQLARRIYGSPFFTPYANLAIPPIRIIVKNMHVTLEGVVVNEMDKVKAGMVANTTGLSFSVTNNLRVVKG